MKIPFVIGKTNKALDMAADLLEEKGWGQGWFYRIDGNTVGNFCAVGALEEVTASASVFGGRCVYGDAMSKFRKHVGQEPSAWNDHPERSAEDVIAAFRLAARTI